MGRRGGNFLVQIISTCLRYAQRKGGGSAPCVFESLTLTVSGRESSSPCSLLAASPSTSSRSSSREATSCL